MTRKIKLTSLFLSSNHDFYTVRAHTDIRKIPVCRGVDSLATFEARVISSRAGVYHGFPQMVSITEVTCCQIPLQQVDKTIYFHSTRNPNISYRCLNQTTFCILSQFRFPRADHLPIMLRHEPISSSFLCELPLPHAVGESVTHSELTGFRATISKCNSLNNFATLVCCEQ